MLISIQLPKFSIRLNLIQIYKLIYIRRRVGIGEMGSIASMCTKVKQGFNREYFVTERKMPVNKKDGDSGQRRALEAEEALDRYSMYSSKIGHSNRPTAEENTLGTRKKGLSMDKHKGQSRQDSRNKKVENKEEKQIKLKQQALYQQALYRKLHPASIKQSRSSPNQRVGYNLPQKQQQKSSSLKENIFFDYLLDYKKYFEGKIPVKMTQSTYNIFSIIGNDDPDRLKLTGLISEILQGQTQINYDKLDWEKIRMFRGIACFMGLAICDAFGASTQFIPFQKDRNTLFSDFQELKSLIAQRKLKPRHGRIGVWTDDCSMALCIADSLLLKDFQFDAKHIRYLFHMWLYHGLNNGGRDHSIGLGGNIKISMDQFLQNQTEQTAQSDGFNNGNGSLMRLAPIPICFSTSQNQCLRYAAKSSRTTHNGEQAKLCSQLLAFIICRLINRQKENKWKEEIDQACREFASIKQLCQNSGVKYLALSQRQPKGFYEYQIKKYGPKFKNFNRTIHDRDWNWKDRKFTYSLTRTELNPGYAGSYCMDALAMALHTVWWTKSFKQVAVKNASMGGDCDTVGAIAGQIAGAIYGFEPQMLQLYSQMQDAKQKKYEVFLKAYKLATRTKLTKSDF